METHSHYRNKQIKMAKCDKYSYSRCMGYCKRPEECAHCTLVKRHSTQIYKWVKGIRYKKCSKCGKYYPVKTGYYKNGSRTTPPAWCKYCHNALQKNNKLKKKNNEKSI